MNGYERLIKIIREEANKNNKKGIMLGEMLSSDSCRAGELILDKDDLLYAEHLMYPVLSKLDIYADKEWRIISDKEDKSRYLNPLKEGDIVLVYQINEEKYVIIEKVVSL